MIKMIEEERLIVELLKKLMINFVLFMDYRKRMLTYLKWKKLKLIIELHIRKVNVIKLLILNWHMFILMVLLIMVNIEQ